MSQSPQSLLTITTHLRIAIPKGYWLSILLLVLPMLACGLPGFAPAPSFHPTGQIVFDCQSERRKRICMVNADGSEKKVISPTPISLPDGISGYNPKSSPDKKKLIFSNRSETNGTTELFIVDQDGKNKKRLVGGGDVLYSSWSPSGEKIAYIYNPIIWHSTKSIYIMNSDGSDQIELGRTFWPVISWSPDGTKLAFNCTSGGICIMNLDGSHLIKLSDSGLAPSWSPDGQYIAYYKNDPACILCPDSGQLWIMHADGSQQKRITEGSLDKNPVWGPLP